VHYVELKLLTTWVKMRKRGFREIREVTKKVRKQTSKSLYTS